MSVKFCDVLCNKRTCYFIVVFTQCLSISCVFDVQVVLHLSGIPLPKEDGFSKFKTF